LEIDGCAADVSKLHGGVIECYRDHRIAMSFAVLGLVVPDIVITDKECTDKTYPEFWYDLEYKFGVKLYVPELKSAATAVDQTSAELSTSGRSDLDLRSIVLVGMRGSGKSTNGARLAARLQWKSIDLDAEFEQAFGKTIKQFVEETSWPEFRKKEEELLRKVVESNPTATVISTGGGVIETPTALEYLRSRTEAGHITSIQIRRNIADVEAYLATDGSRANLGEDVMTLWNRRRPLYESCSSHEVYLRKGDENWESVEENLYRLVRRIQFNTKSCNEMPCPSFFLSLTSKRIEEALPILPELQAGVQAVELRVDLLESQDLEFVRDQLTLLRQHCSVPIIFTLRTKDQGGSLDAKGDEALIFSVLLLGIRLGCEFIDYENCWSDGLKKRVLSAAAASRSATIISSFHDFNSKPTKELVIEYYRKCVAGLDDADTDTILKIVVFAQEPEDVFVLHEGVREAAKAAGGRKKRTIALAAGAKGKLSRVTNEFMTPVTHPLLHAAAAPGQLSVKQIVSLRGALGLSSS
jgi:pentafunctional AROM polypeptide